MISGSVVSFFHTELEVCAVSNMGIARRKIWYHTKSYPNLGSTSSRRGESYHGVLRELTNGQLCLEDATKRSISKVLSISKDIETSEGISTRLYPCLLQSDPQTFRNLRCTIIIYAAEKIEPEWKAVQML